ncbi:MAG: hypothetical protein KatS3mg077_1654 [Candidatus Binatia bacterium]|nr:MAG: hypothetical protein KatS3mg077_1654 [Candidatus Binatia bacterium]
MTRGVVAIVVVLSLLLLAVVFLLVPHLPEPGRAQPRGKPAAALDQCPIGELRTDVVVPGVREVVRAPRKEAWERQFQTKAEILAALRGRLAGWPERPPTAMPELPAGPEEFLRQVARDTWKGLYSLRDREHGLPIDHVRWLGPSWAPSDAKIGDYSSSSNIGLFLLAVVAARDLGLETHDSAVSLVRAVLRTLGKLERYRGFFFNYYDTTSLERTSHLISFVDSSWLSAGLIVVRNAMPELWALASHFLDAENYRFFYDPRLGQMRHGYYVNPGAYSPFHYGMLFTEARVGSLLAIGKGDVPRVHWYAMVRTYPPGCGWQRQRPLAATAERRNGFVSYSGYYQWNGVTYVPSWGGSMFEALMPLLLVDEPRRAPHGWGANALAHAVVQRRYAREVLHQEVWGESPCMNPHEIEYREYGIPPLGTRGYPSGAVTPHAAALALAVTPHEAIANLQLLPRLYPIYGEFGFFDAVDPRTGVVARGYLNLDQAMILVAIANYLLPGGVRQYFENDAWVRPTLPLLAEENLFGAIDPTPVRQ